MFTSGLVGIIITLVVIGLLLYLVDLIPMDSAIKQIIRIIVIIAVVIWLLEAFGLIGSINQIFHPAPVHPSTTH
ncbi:MAG TPA: Thivi_2564 family membrane protein [Acidobacteriaceae bacterium]|nr:Thivi_2564 family membrane protein [Acidobacteriaceae bacterium]